VPTVTYLSCHIPSEFAEKLAWRGSDRTVFNTLSNGVEAQVINPTISPIHGRRSTV
jgi:hypothetical protein